MSERPAAGSRRSTPTRGSTVRDDQGYGVWRLDDLDDGDPIERFSDDDTGYQLASDTWAALTP